MNYQEVNKVLALSSNKIEKCIRKKKRENAARWLSLRSVALYELNSFLYDETIEEGIHRIGTQIEENIIHYKNTSNGNGIVFYDVTSWDRRGLSNQYVDALIENKVHFLYLTENKSFETTIICKRIKEYEDGDYIIIPSFYQTIEKSYYIYNTICRYSPKQILLHILPWSIPVLLALSFLPKDIVIININITDHAFWAGSSLMDYNIEFREYGRYLSTNNRCLRENQEFVLPYYPYIEETAFEGFGNIRTEGKIILFWGGALYKIYDEQLVFLKLVAKILKQHPDTICICAGGGDARKLDSFIKENDLCSSWYYIGYRNDIFQVINHCDIILNTYPISGGLICQYAANCSKPIISFGDIRQKRKAIEGILSTDETITYFDEDSFLSQVDYLIRNRMAREELGKSLKKVQFGKKDFCKLLKIIIENTTCKNTYHRSPKTIESDCCVMKKDYEIESSLIKYIVI